MKITLVHYTNTVLKALARLELQAMCHLIFPRALCRKCMPEVILATLSIFQQVGTLVKLTLVTLDTPIKSTKCYHAQLDITALTVVTSRLNVQLVLSETISTVKMSRIVVSALLELIAHLSVCQHLLCVVMVNSAQKVLSSNKIVLLGHTMMNKEFMTHVVAKSAQLVAIVHSSAKHKYIQSMNVMLVSYA